MITCAVEGSRWAAWWGEWTAEIPSELGSFPAVADTHWDSHCLRGHSKWPGGSWTVAARSCTAQTGDWHVCTRLCTDERIWTESCRGTRRCPVHVPQRGQCRLWSSLLSMNVFWSKQIKIFFWAIMMAQISVAHRHLYSCMHRPANELMLSICCRYCTESNCVSIFQIRILSLLSIIYLCFSVIFVLKSWTLRCKNYVISLIIQHNIMSLILQFQ